MAKTSKNKKPEELKLEDVLGACQTFWKQTCKKFCHCTKMVHNIVQ